MKNNIKSAKIFYVIFVLTLCFMLIFSIFNTGIGYAETLEGTCESQITLQQIEEPEPTPDPDPEPTPQDNSNSSNTISKGTKTADNNFISIILILLLLLVSTGSLIISIQNSTCLTSSIKSYFNNTNTKTKQE